MPPSTSRSELVSTGNAANWKPDACASTTNKAVAPPGGCRQRNVNIAAMEVGRKTQGGLAVMGLTLDGAVPPETLARIVEEIGAERAHTITLPD